MTGMKVVIDGYALNLSQGKTAFLQPGYESEKRRNHP